jgi:His/Glu/Gln/Arg/opine family amino acid ABC transporter permease subunit
VYDRPGLVRRSRSYLRLPLVLLFASILVSCGSEVQGGYTWGWFRVSPLTEVGRRNLQFLLRGYVPTLAVSFASWGVSIILGLILAVFGLAKNRIARGVNRTYVTIFRSIPVLVMILWVYYGLPVSIGLNLSVFASAVVALSLCDAAFEAEIFRGGIQSIEPDQLESARSLGFTPYQTYVHVLLPQAIRRILPPLLNQFVYILKISSLVSVIGLGDLTRRANELNVNEYRPLEIYTILILEYLVIILLATFLVRKLEKALGTY